MKAFTLVGVDGNAFSIMGYTARALKTAGLRNKVDEMHKEATAGDYYHLIAVCDGYIDMANDKLREEGKLEEEEEEEDD